MNRAETILIIVFLFIFIIYLSLATYLFYMAYANGKNTYKVDKPLVEFTKDIDVSSPYHTDFFNKSSLLAGQILFGKSISHEYADNYYSHKLMDVINKLNDETKKSIVVAIKFMGIEPSAARNNENVFRETAESERLPVWFVILREATKKVVPEFIDNNASPKDNIVPLYQQTG